MKKLFKYLTIDRQFITDLSRSELEEYLYRNSQSLNEGPFRVARLSDSRFSIKANSSLGVMMANGGWGKAINVILQLNKN